MLNTLGIIITEMNRKHKRGNVTKSAYVLCLTILPLYYVHFSNGYIVFRPFRHIFALPIYRCWCFIRCYIGHVNLLSYFTSQMRYSRIHFTPENYFCYSFFFNNRSGRTRVITFPSILWNYITFFRKLLLIS